MKVFRTTVAVIAFAAFAILAHTQTRPAAPTVAPPQTRPTAAPGNIAVIDSSAFSDDKNGIARVMVAMRQIEAKFQQKLIEHISLLAPLDEMLGISQKTVLEISSVRLPRSNVG